MKLECCHANATVGSLYIDVKLQSVSSVNNINSLECRIFLSDFNHIWISWTDLALYFTKIRSVGPELMHADGRVDGHDEASRRPS
jgi:hypothetical protein